MFNYALTAPLRAVLTAGIGTLLLIGGATTTTAGVFTYDFTTATFSSGNHGSNNSSTPDLLHPDINKGVKLKIFGGRIECEDSVHLDRCRGDLEEFRDKKVHVNGEGIGVYNPVFILGDSREIDGFPHSESLRLMFDFGMSVVTEATLLSLEFDIDSFRILGHRILDLDDELELLIDGVNIDVTSLMGGSNLIGDTFFQTRRTCNYQGDFDNCLIDLSGLGLTGAMFDIVAEDIFDDFRLARATFWIPEPGTLALFGLGLAGFGLARRRRAA